MQFSIVKFEHNQKVEKIVRMQKLMFQIEFFSKSTRRITVFVCKSEISKREKRNKKSKWKAECRRRHRWRKSQVFQIDIGRKLEDSSKTGSLT